MRPYLSAQSFLWNNPARHRKKVYKHICSIGQWLECRVFRLLSVFCRLLYSLVAQCGQHLYWLDFRGINIPPYSAQRFKSLSRCEVSAYFSSQNIPFQTVSRFSRGLSMDKFLIARALYLESKPEKLVISQCHNAGVKRSFIPKSY